MPDTYALYRSLSARPLGKRAFSLLFANKAPYFRTVRPQVLNILAFDADDEKIVRMEGPFWLLRLKSGGNFTMNGNHVDMAKLHLTVDDLDRYGPTLIVDHKDSKGAHVLVWTQ